MNATGYLLIAAISLIFNAGVIHAAGSAPDTLPVIERQAVKIPALPGDGVPVSIPRAALTMRNGIPGVFVVENNETRFRMVRAGKIGATRVDILSGLFGEETLVLGELEAVHDGSPIKLLTGKSPDNK